MTLPTEKSSITEESFRSTPYEINPFLSTIFNSPQLQQQFFLTQFFLSGATNPLSHALQILLRNSCPQLFPSIPSVHPIIEKRKSKKLPKSSRDDSSSDTNERSTFDDDDNSPTIASLTANHHRKNEFDRDLSTNDQIDLEEIKQFAKAFKLRRLALGLTQTQVGQALSVTRGPAYSQSAICRFEKLDITPKSASKIKPVLEKWMQEAEVKYGDRLRKGTSNFNELLTDLNTKKRKRRTSFTPQALDKLNDAFEFNSHPSGLDMSALAQELNYDREVIRVWFCNKRQALKNSAKKFKTNSINEENESTTSSSELTAHQHDEKND